MKVAHLVIETAFSDDERQLARISRHLCPAALGHELQHLAGSVDVHITHIKPGERAAVMAEIGKLGSPHKIRALEIGDVMRLDRRAQAGLRLSRADGPPGAGGVTECVSIDPIRKEFAGFGDRLCHVVGWSSRFQVSAAWHVPCNELGVFPPLLPNRSSP